MFQNIADGATSLRDVQEKGHTLEKLQSKMSRSLDHVLHEENYGLYESERSKDDDIIPIKLQLMERSLEILVKLLDNKIDKAKWLTRIMVEENQIITNLISIISASHYFRRLQYLAISILLHVVLNSLLLLVDRLLSRLNPCH